MSKKKRANKIYFCALENFTYGQEVEIDGLVAPRVQVAIADLTCGAVDLDGCFSTPGDVNMDGELIHELEHQFTFCTI